ncbi:MAG: hypothetical protein ACOC41_05740 [Chitinivibrionales bacterium]
MKMQYEILDIHNESEVAAYERAMYRAFSGSEIVTLDKIWQFDHKNRKLRTRIPYDDQEIYVARLDDSVVAGVAVNYAMDKILQLEMMGFSIDKNRKGICEGLGIFNLRVFHNSSMVALTLKQHMFEKMRERGIVRAYGTCSTRKLRGYLHLGWRLIDQRQFEGEQKYLLEMIGPDSR